MQSVAPTEATRDEISGSEVELDFSELFQLYYPRIYRYLRYRAESQQDAEDLASMTFERAFTRREQFDAARGTFSGWLFRIAHNVLANYFRTRQRRTVNEAEGDLPAEMMTPDPSPETKVIRAEAIAGLMRSLKYLSERDQEIISLKFAGQLSNKEIGQVMELSEKTVSVVLWRAMRRLQKQLKGEAS